MSGLDTLFKKGGEKDLQQEGITNPFDLNFSYNFVFDDNSLFDQAASDDNISTANGKLVLSSGSTGTFVSLNKATTDDVSKVHVKAIGEDLGNVVFEVSADNGNNFQTVTLEALEGIDDKGNGLRLRVALNASTARVDSAVILYS